MSRIGNKHIVIPEGVEVCPKCGKTTRVEYKVENDKKVRVCKKCGANIK